ncbi:MAG: aminotransferase class I/II-fold pyridoxal phosphate-dependent enzyme, partial [Simkaniaceae bacterium]|nr:aminotransferase class I/II-fold pyridoxal phosphate-dependent enzyme [Simkaniaceae bacterium]
SDSAGLQELFCRSAIVGITDPTYPTYVDVNIMDGRHEVKYLPCKPENNFVPQPPNYHLDLIYLCTPNNPTGTAMTKDDLAAWIVYAKQEEAIILLDAAYERFITSDDVPHSIYSLPDAKQVAIEMRTFSKSAGFTGLRCAYTVVPRETELLAMWKMRQNNKCNGVSYPVQKGAAASLTPQGTTETSAAIAEYQNEMATLHAGLQKMGYTVYGGVDAPYLFWKTPNGETSWEFFDTLLEKCHLISIPGSSFGPCGEGYVRLSGFLRTGIAKQALSRIALL